jgi:hypothetical protein
MSELVIDDNDPRIVVQTLAEGPWKTVTRELIRIDGVIWYRLTTVYGTPVTTVGEWKEMSDSFKDDVYRNYRGEIVRVVLTKNPEFEKCHTVLDRHEIELEHAADPLNSRVLAGGAL